MTIHTGGRAATERATSGRLEELYTLHAPAGLRFAYYLCGDREQARDLVQDAFVKIAGRLGHLRQPERFDTYLRRSIVNLHMSRLRRLRLERQHLARERTARERGPDPEAPGTPRGGDAIWNAILALPERQRAAIVLRYYEDLSERESAEILRCSVGALNQLVVRASATLRRTIPGGDTR